MRFEHRVEISNLKNSSVSTITREQLWNGLVLRAEFPQLFLSNLDACLITSRSNDVWTRELRFGELKIVDQVQFDFLNFVHYQVHCQGEIPESSMRMTIEESASSVLSIRFNYENDESEAEGKKNVIYNEYRCAAYTESDLETIRILREIHESGRLNQASFKFKKECE